MGRRRSSWFRLTVVGVGVLLCGLLAGGCSVQMAYNNLDRLARWSVSDYVDMNDAQRAYFDARFDQLWDWHRRERLPAYADFLDDLPQRLLDDPNDAQMQAVVDQVLAWAEELETRSMPMAAELLASLTPEQVDELAEALEEANRELEEPELDVPVADAQQAWVDDFADNFSRFSGRLNTVQRAYLRDRATDYRPELVLWADYRRRWQQDFLALLVARPHVDALERGLRQLSRYRELYYGAELTAIREHNDRLAREISVWLLGSLTQRQQERFSDRVAELAEDFRQLAADDRPRQDGASPPCLVRC